MDNIIIKPSSDGFLIINLTKVDKYGFEKAHSHIKNKLVAKTIKTNVLKCRFPKTRNEYLLTSHIRLSDDESYIQKIKQLLKTRRQKGKSKYINIQKGT